MVCRVDHLVVLAADLESGILWSERVLGMTPGPGGAHPLMGTHNRLLQIAGPRFPDAYLEIIAIDPSVRPQRAAPLARWFDFDDPALQDDLRRRGPQLAHWVARTDSLQSCVSEWLGLGIDRGPALEASRMTPQGLLSWRITVRDDGQRLFDGCLPTLIEWGDVHPAHTMAASGLVIEQLHLTHPRSDDLRTALAAAKLAELEQSIKVTQGPFSLRADLRRPDGTLLRIGGLST